MDVEIRAEDAGDSILIRLDENFIKPLDFDLGLIGETTGHAGGVFFVLGLVSSLNSEGLESFPREEIFLAVEIVEEVFGLIGVEEELELFLNSGNEFVLVYLNFPSDLLLRLDQVDLYLQVGEGSFQLIMELVRLDQDRLRGLVEAQVLPDVETHPDLALFDVLVECAFEDLPVDQDVYDLVRVLGHLCRDVHRVLDRVLVTQMLDAGRRELHFTI